MDQAVRQLAELLSHAHGHGPHLFVHLAVEEGGIGSQHAGHIVRARRPVRRQQGNGISRCRLAGCGHDELAQRFHIVNKVLLNRGL